MLVETRSKTHIINDCKFFALITSVAEIVLFYAVEWKLKSEMLLAELDYLKGGCAGGDMGK
jgi:hypothetical protein